MLQQRWYELDSPDNRYTSATDLVVPALRREIPGRIPLIVSSQSAWLDKRRLYAGLRRSFVSQRERLVFRPPKPTALLGIGLIITSIF